VRLDVSREEPRNPHFPSPPPPPLLLSLVSRCLWLLERHLLTNLPSRNTCSTHMSEHLTRIVNRP
jgi:hypothetical protein